ncbi:MAG TPA: TetR/AcrR family transcriptional regulator [Steroidobacteraceae bacterium]|nr:TetR/AcrR family transcriptional regulator [Steroidobacteraceae bacterium]
MLRKLTGSIGRRVDKKNFSESKQRSRLSPEARRMQILDSAAKMIVKQGYLPLPIEQLAQSMGISKALIYAYFPDQYALFNHLLERELSGLLTGGLDITSDVQDIEQSTVLSAMLYFEHVARLGPLLNILLSDRYMSGHFELRLLRTRNLILQRLGKQAAKKLRLREHDALAAIQMMTAIPEELGRLVFVGQLDTLIAQQLCRQMILSSMHALRDTERALAIATL